MRRLYLIGGAAFLAACAPSEKAIPSKAAETPAARILQFYAAPSLISPGESASLCYGVEHASTVKIAPAVEELKPAFSRCFPVSPKTDTEYTLTAVGADGGETSRTAKVTVDASAPKHAASASAGPLILDFRVNPAEAAPGTSIMFCFHVDQAARARLEPPVQTLGSALQGCFSVAVKQTTTYTLIAEGDGGKTARRSVTVTIR